MRRAWEAAKAGRRDVPIRDAGAASRAPTTTSAESNARVLRICLRTLLAVLCIVALRRWIVGAIPIFQHPGDSFDFNIYYAAALALRDNPAANLYDASVLHSAALAHHAIVPQAWYLYPPFLAVILIPLTALPEAAAAILWGALNLVLQLGCVVLMGSLIRSLGADSPAMTASSRADRRDMTLLLGALLLFMTLAFDPFAQGIALGQINAVVCFLLLLAPWLQQRGHDRLAGVLLAVATLLKVYPALLLLYYALRGCWRVALAGVAALLLLTLAMIPLLGIGGVLATRELLPLGSAVTGSVHNEALLRVPLWLAIGLGARFPLGALSGRPDTPLGLLGTLLAAMVALTLAAGVYRATRRRTRTSSDLARADSHPADLLGYLWALTTMVLVAPLAWEHHYTWLLPGFVICLAYILHRFLWEHPTGMRLSVRDALVVVALVVGFALVTTSLPFGYDGGGGFYDGPFLLGHSIRPYFMLMRPIGGLLLWGASGLLFLDAARGQSGSSHISGADAAAVLTAPPPASISGALVLRRQAAFLLGLLVAVMAVRGVGLLLMAQFGLPNAL